MRSHSDATRAIRRLSLGAFLAFAGGYAAHAVQTANGVTVRDVRFPGDSGLVMSALLYTPASATPDHRAPAVLLSHGYINTREMQSAFAIELSRRGFVVLAMDMTGHGYSGGTVGAQRYGGPAALRYLRRLPTVDTLNIGLEAHSMGGGPILAAAASAPGGYASVVLEGTATGVFGRSGVGSPAFPRNTAVVFGRYDEFASRMWSVDKGSDVGRSAKLQTMFGTTTAVEPGRLYGSVDSGTARMLYLPGITHPMEHFSASGVGAAIDWFQKTLKGGTALDPRDQVWLWKEYATLASFVGFVVLMLGTFQLLLTTSFFAALAAPAAPNTERRDARWWVAFAVTAVIPAATYFPFMKFGSNVKPTAFLPQGIMNQLLAWALLNGILTLAIGVVLRRPGSATTGAARTDWLRSALIAIAVIAAGYLCLVLVDAMFTVDFRFWVVGLKPFDARHFRIALAYLLPWTAFFLISLRALNANVSVRGEGAAMQYAAAAIALCGGFAALIVLEYSSLFATGMLVTPKESLNTVIAIQFVPLLAVIGLVSAFTFRRTNSYAPGAMICAMFVTWYIAAGTAIHA